MCGVPQSSRRNVDARLTQACKLVTERARADAEPFRSFAPAAAGAQRFENQISLCFVEATRKRACSSRHRDVLLLHLRGDCRMQGLVDELELNVFRLNDRAVYQNQRALQKVVELAHVAGP